MHPWLHGREAVVFDFYGTLIQDDVTVPRMWRYLANLGYPSHAELEAAFEPNAFDGCLTPTGSAHDAWLEEHWRAFLRLSGVSRGAEDVVLAGLLRTREEFDVRAASGAHALLAALRAAGAHVAVCSNWETPIEPYLQRAGLSGFDAVVTSRDTGARKPHRAIYDEVLVRLNVTADRTVFVGDTWEADIVGALRAGMSPVWLREGRLSRALDHVLEVDALADLLES